jgi:hypothetical protein
VVLVRILREGSDLGGIPVRNFVHEIDTKRHPTQPPGWRWAVHLGDNPEDIGTCLQAGWSQHQSAACWDGDQVAAAVVNAFRLVGNPVVWNGPTVLEYDPTPAEKAA